MYSPSSSCSRPALAISIARSATLSPCRAASALLTAGSIMALKRSSKAWMGVTCQQTSAL